MAETNVFIYWGSDPRSLDVAQHHYRVTADHDLHDKNGNLPYHLHESEPDAKLKDAVWDDNANGWVENDGNQQVQILYNAQQDLNNKLASLKQTADQLTQDKTDLQNDLKTVQQSQVLAGQQSTALTKTLTKVMTSQANNAKLMQSMQGILMGIQQELNAAAKTPAAPAQPASGSESDSNSASEPAQPTQAK